MNTPKRVGKMLYKKYDLHINKNWIGLCKLMLMMKMVMTTRTLGAIPIQFIRYHFIDPISCDIAFVITTIQTLCMHVAVIVLLVVITKRFSQTRYSLKLFCCVPLRAAVLCEMEQ